MRNSDGAAAVDGFGGHITYLRVILSLATPRLALTLLATALVLLGLLRGRPAPRQAPTPAPHSTAALSRASPAAASVN